MLGGITGITHKPSDLAPFFLVATDISCIADEFDHETGLTKATISIKHHDLSEPVIQRYEKSIAKLRQTFERANPFQYEQPHLVNTVTQTVLSSDVEQDILKSVGCVEQAYTEFRQERIIGSKNVWDKMT